MKQLTQNGGQGPGWILSELVEKKKKTITAFCLVALMAFMWIRVITGSKPSTASSALLEKQMMEQQSKKDFQVSFVELPKVRGRNDVLTRDFFVADFKSLCGDKAARFVPIGGANDYMKIITAKLKLGAIVVGEQPRAFINDELLSVGDTLMVNDGIENRKCKIVAIENEAVSLKCGETEVVLKLAQAIGEPD